MACCLGPNIKICLFDNNITVVHRNLAIMQLCISCKEVDEAQAFPFCEAGNIKLQSISTLYSCMQYILLLCNDESRHYTATAAAYQNRLLVIYIPFITKKEDVQHA